KLITPEELDTMVNSMVRLNKYAADVVANYDVHAMTDVTGYGLVGHLLEMLDSSGMDAKIFVDQLPVLPGTFKYAEQKVVPGGLLSNRKFYNPRISVGAGVTRLEELLVVDPQTSGGLLISLAAENAQAFVNDLQKNGVEDARIIGEISNSSNEPRISLHK
ncbi:MAG: selenide, water dikinase SelD, partial [FCB group bacterium]|nr:selenide, water dikinase SelD [FCB group bacterium]